MYKFMYENIIANLLRSAEVLVEEAKKENPDFDAGDKILAGIARAQIGIEKETERKMVDNYESSDLRKLFIKGYHLDKEIKGNCAEKVYFVSNDNNDDSLTISFAREWNSDGKVEYDEFIKFIVIDKYVACEFYGSYVVMTEAKYKWNKNDYKEVSKLINNVLHS